MPWALAAGNEFAIKPRKKASGAANETCPPDAALIKALTAVLVGAKMVALAPGFFNIESIFDA